MRLAIAPPQMHDGQLEVMEDQSRFKVLAAGRRWGKTRLGTWLCLETALQGGRAWWVAPTFSTARVGWRTIKELALQLPGTKKSEMEKFVQLANGGVVQVRSADDPDSLRGEGLDFIVLDEAAYIPEGAWNASLRPTLSDRQGKALFISTPRGANWFYRLWLRGQQDDPAYRSWRRPTSDNPFILPEEIEEAREQLPERIFAQEYLASFEESAGKVFRDVRSCIYAKPGAVSPERGKRYVMGIDWAQLTNWTVLTVMDADLRVVEIDRFNRIGWEVQRQRVESLAERWDCSYILAESNAMGTPNIEALASAGFPIEGFTTSNQSKTELVQRLMLAFETGDIGIIDDSQLVNELESFEATRLPSGRWRYQAPEGCNDDMVISLCLAYEAARMGVGWSVAWIPT